MSAPLQVIQVRFLPKPPPVIKRRRLTDGDLYAMSLTAACSYVAWSGWSLWLLPFSLVLPWALGRASRRGTAALIAAGYFANALSPIIAASRLFFGKESFASGVILFVLAVTVSSAIFAAIWSPDPKRRPFCVLIAILVHAWLIGVASPLVAAGVAYPDAGWIGLIGFIFTCFVLATPARYWQGRLVFILMTLFTSVVLNWTYTERPAPAGWTAVNTTFGKGDQHQDFARLKEIESYVLTHHEAQVFLFPESLVHWQAGPWLDNVLLAQQGKTVLFGAETMIDGKRLNTMWATGSANDMYVQREPVPVAMAAFTAYPNGKGTVLINGTRAGVLLCYEQLTVREPLSTLKENPQVLLAASNLHWVKDVPHIGWVQEISVRSWARLFGVPWLRAVNE